MSILKVSLLGHPVLRRQSERLTQETLSSPNIQTLIDNMIVTMGEYHGVGLAAPQVHEALCIAVIESKGPRGDIPLTVLVNPDVTVLDQQIVEDWEGCLSIPQLRGRVPRYRRLRVDAWDRYGRQIHFVAEDFFARVIQHEFDHIVGHVYLDRMRDFTTLTHFDEFQRYWQQQS